MMDKIANFLLKGGVSDEEYKILKEDISKENYHTGRVFLLLFGIAEMIMVIMDITIPIGRNELIIQLSYSLMCIMGAVLYKDKKANTVQSVSVAIVILIIVYGLIFALICPDRSMTAYLSFVILMPMLFCLRPINNTIIVIVSIAFSIAANLLWRSPDVRMLDIINSVIYGMAALLCSAGINAKRIQCFKYARNYEMLAIHDSMTGMFNRTYYSVKIKEYTQAGIIPSCIYIDVNGLHEYNDKYGHDAGDVMLKFVADAIMKYFGKENSFRIGGDEYVVFLNEGSEEEIKKTTEELNRYVIDGGFNVSYGCSFTSGSYNCIEDAIKEAEKMMYKNKADFYKKSGNSRRRSE